MALSTSRRGLLVKSLSLSLFAVVSVGRAVMRRDPAVCEVGALSRNLPRRNAAFMLRTIPVSRRAVVGPQRMDIDTLASINDKWCRRDLGKRNMQLRAGLAVAVLVFAVAQPAFAEDAVGKWSGKISAGGAELPIIVTVQKAADGALAGYLESPSQTTEHIPISAVTSDGKSLSFLSIDVMGAYEAKWDEAKKAWVGQWSQNGVDLQLDLSRAK
jgi:hypothetical protein